MISLLTSALRQRSGSALAAVAGVVALSLGSSALAATPSPKAQATPGLETFGIKPSHANHRTPVDARSRYDYTATPGAVIKDYVDVSNIGSSPLTLSVYASDAFNTSSEGYDVLPASTKPTDVGSWVALKSLQVTIAGRKDVIVPFTITVPAKVAPGDHDGGIVASVRTVSLDKKGDKVAVDHRVGVRVYLRVQGPLDPRLAVTSLRASYSGSWWNPFGRGKVRVSYTLHNPGNVRLGANQLLSVSGTYGGVVNSAPIHDVAELLPDNSHQESVLISGVRPAFHEKVVLTVVPFSLPGDADGRLTTLVQTTSISAVPWGLMCLVVLVLLLLLLAGRAVRRRRQAVSAPADTNADSQPGPTVGAAS